MSIYYLRSSSSSSQVPVYSASGIVRDTLECFLAKLLVWFSRLELDFRPTTTMSGVGRGVSWTSTIVGFVDTHLQCVEFGCLQTNTHTHTELHIGWWIVGGIKIPDGLTFYLFENPRQFSRVPRVIFPPREKYLPQWFNSFHYLFWRGPFL